MIGAMVPSPPQAAAKEKTNGSRKKPVVRRRFILSLLS
jgi:hypothetical protein